MPLARDREELRAMLFRLNTLIVNFVTNPYFRNPKVFDAELVSKASRDLNDIIQLSRTLRKNSERLNTKQEQ